MRAPNSTSGATSSTPRVVDELQVDVFCFGILTDFRTRLCPAPSGSSSSPTGCTSSRARPCAGAGSGRRTTHTRRTAKWSRRARSSWWATWRTRPTGDEAGGGLRGALPTRGAPGRPRRLHGARRALAARAVRRPLRLRGGPRPGCGVRRPGGGPGRPGRLPRPAPVAGSGQVRRGDAPLRGELVPDGWSPTTTSAATPRRGPGGCCGTTATVTSASSTGTGRAGVRRLRAPPWCAAGPRRGRGRSGGLPRRPRRRAGTGTLPGRGRALRPGRRAHPRRGERPLGEQPGRRRRAGRAVQVGRGPASGVRRGAAGPRQ